MKIRFYIDPITKDPHIYKHNIYEKDVIDILNHPGEDRTGKNNSRVAIGQTQSGRYVRVIYVYDSISESIFVITAYEIKGKTLAAYKRRKKKRG